MDLINKKVDRICRVYPIDAVHNVTISLVSYQHNYIVYLYAGNKYLNKTKCSSNYQALKCVDNYKKSYFNRYKTVNNLN